ncbi:potassium channel family protein [Oceanospirillum sediminis]|uniref:Potassium channel domain-containing protein n=1 Tax=Oceanospirillum sediminis TaxID=2760088 RepID=A0A839IU73_9GAMM|nr:potassium channel family protein [Oceanospirillum sediminis]MBB1488029.1 hypothetical protein [Oceanospirillum sediminis]
MPVLRQLYQQLVYQIQILSPMVFIGFVLLHYLICWTGLSLAGEEALTDIVNFIYFCSVVGSTVGFGDLSPSGDAGKLFLTFYMIPATIILYAAGLTKIAWIFQTMREMNIKGQRDFSDYNDHVILFGWQPVIGKKTIECILKDKKRANSKIIICTTDDQQTHPMLEHPDVRFACVSSYTDDQELERIALARANRVMIHALNDQDTITIALKVSPLVRTSCHVVAFFNDESASRLLDNHCRNIECFSDRTAEQLARSVQDPGASRGINQLLDPGKGATHYCLLIPESAPVMKVINLRLALMLDYNATLYGISERKTGDDLRLNPDKDTTITAGTYIHYIAQERLLAEDIDWDKAARWQL